MHFSVHENLKDPGLIQGQRSEYGRLYIPAAHIFQWDPSSQLFSSGRQTRPSGYYCAAGHHSWQLSVCHSDFVILNMLQALLSNAFAWMRKASDDKLDGMVALLQKALQLYAAKTLSSSGAGANNILSQPTAPLPWQLASSPITPS